MAKANEGKQKADELKRAIAGGGVRSMGDHPFERWSETNWQDWDSILQPLNPQRSLIADQPPRHAVMFERKVRL